VPHLSFERSRWLLLAEHPGYSSDLSPFPGIYDDGATVARDDHGPGKHD
jgi:hypothetical protein